MGVKCYPIMNAGEGDRGKEIPVLQRPGKSAADYAEEAAHVLDDAEAFQEGWGDSDQGLFHGGSHVIEVVGHPWHPDPIRYSVRCEVVRQYSATRV